MSRCVFLAEVEAHHQTFALIELVHQHLGLLNSPSSLSSPIPPPHTFLVSLVPHLSKSYPHFSTSLKTFVSIKQCSSFRQTFVHQSAETIPYPPSSSLNKLVHHPPPILLNMFCSVKSCSSNRSARNRT